MKKIIWYFLALIFLTGCYSHQNVAVSSIDNHKTAFQNYFVYLKNGEKIKAKYIFNRDENLEIYLQGQSKMIPINEIEKIEGRNLDNKKIYILLGGSMIALYGISLILKNNGVDVKYGQNEK